MKTIIIICLILVILFSSGCIERKDREVEIYNIGKEGLEMSFLENNPPDEVWDNSDISIAIEVRNLGNSKIPEKYDSYNVIVQGGGVSVEGGWISPRGFSKAYIKNIEPKEIKLDGRTDFNPEGGYTIMEFRGKINPLGDVLYDYITQPIVIAACYIYRTKASPGVCMNSKLVGSEGDACQIKDMALESQSAPVAITEIEHDVTPSEDEVEFFFVIHVENIGDGEVIKQPIVNKECSGSNLKTILGQSFTVDEIPSYQQLNRVYVESINLHGKNGERMDPIKVEDGSYDPSNIIILNSEGKGIAVYKFKFKKKDLAVPFVAPLNIKLKYGYREYISKEIIIRKRTRPVL